MKTSARRMCCLLLALLPCAAIAQGGVGGDDDGGNAIVSSVGYIAGWTVLYRIDLTTGQAIERGPFGFFGGAEITDVDGLAFSPDGTLYGVADSPQVLFRVSLTSGRATVIGRLREGNVFFDPTIFPNGTLSFTCDGRLLMSSRTLRKVWQLDPATAVATQIGTTSPLIAGLAIRGEQALALGVAGAEGLYTFDPLTGMTVKIPNSLNERSIAGGSIAFAADGRLFGVFDLAPAIQRQVLVELSPTSGAILRETTITGSMLEGGGERRPVRALAIAPPVCAPSVLAPGASAIPVNSPFALILLIVAVGLGAVIALRRRQSRSN